MFQKKEDGAIKVVLPADYVLRRLGPPEQCAPAAARGEPGCEELAGSRPRPLGRGRRASGCAVACRAPGRRPSTAGRAPLSDPTAPSELLARAVLSGAGRRTPCRPSPAPWAGAQVNVAAAAPRSAARAASPDGRGGSGELRRADRWIGGEVERAARVDGAPPGGRRRRRRANGPPGSAGGAASGTNGISPGRSSARGRNGPANSRRISVAACALKISPGRIRTTRSAGARARAGRACRSPRPCGANRTRFGPRSVGHDSSTSRSFGPGEYAPTDEAYTSAGTPASTAPGRPARCRPR